MALNSLLRLLILEVPAEVVHKDGPGVDPIPLAV